MTEYVVGADGKPLLDRYGRPVVRRSANPGAGAPRQQARRLAPGQQPPQSYQQPPRQYQAPRQQQQQPVRQRPPRRPDYASVPVQQAQQAPQARHIQSRHPHRRAQRRDPVALIGGAIAALVVFSLVFSLVFALWTDTRLTRIQALDYQHVADTSGTNWLLVGSDSRAGLTEEEQIELGTGGDVGGMRTDTIMLLHIPRSGTAQLVSIPRDSYVDIPGFGMDKINAAFTYGGAPLLGQTIEQWSGLRIDHYAEIGMGGLANVANVVGGVDICVAEPIDDPMAGINLQAGCQNLQGRDALGYVRTRATAMGDLDRVQRQREFFAALLNKVTSPMTIINPFRFVSLVNHTANSFVVGQGDHVWNLARVALAMGSGVQTQTVPVSGFADTAVGNVVLWDDAQTAALWDSLR